jgi:hypothetical protein
MIAISFITQHLNRMKIYLTPKCELAHTPSTHSMTWLRNWLEVVGICCVNAQDIAYYKVLVSQ